MKPETVSPISPDLRVIRFSLTLRSRWLLLKCSFRLVDNVFLFIKGRDCPITELTHPEQKRIMDALQKLS